MVSVKEIQTLDLNFNRCLGIGGCRLRSGRGLRQRGKTHQVIFLWARRRSKIAAAFILRVITINMSPAAAALD